MENRDHLQKASRLISSLGKCAPEDYEAIIEGCMLAATHLFNAALHAKGIRPVQQDVMHGTKLTVEEHIRCNVLLPEILESLEVIEELRSPFVRGAQPDGVEAGQLARKSLALIQAETLDLIAR